MLDYMLVKHLIEAIFKQLVDRICLHLLLLVETYLCLSLKVGHIREVNLRGYDTCSSHDFLLFGEILDYISLHEEVATILLAEPGGHRSVIALQTRASCVEDSRAHLIFEGA